MYQIHPDSDRMQDKIPQSCMYKSSWGWTLGCSKHVEDNVIELNHWWKKSLHYLSIMLHCVEVSITKEHTEIAKLSSIFTLTFSNRPIQTPNCAAVHQKYPDLFNGITLFSVRYEINFHTKFWIYLAFTWRKHNGQYNYHLIKNKFKTLHLTNSVFLGFALFSK
jgi:hypothetical protein